MLIFMILHTVELIMTRKLKEDLGKKIKWQKKTQTYLV